MAKASTFVGLDVHKNSIVIALLRPGQATPLEWKVRNEPMAVHRLIRKLEHEDGVQCCYEAGPTGYVLKRQLDRAGISCQVIAPSLIPVKPGSAIKTDRRDARKLAELLRAGMLTEVQPPTEDEEAVRDLTRSRDDAQRDLTRARNRLSKFLLRRGCVYAIDRKPTWSQKYRSWLRALRFERAPCRRLAENRTTVPAGHATSSTGLSSTSVHPPCANSPARCACGLARGVASR